MASRPSVRTQFLIFNLYGDYVFPRRRPVWTGGLLDVLRVLGVGDRAARSTLSRMKQKGWLEASRQGRRSAYRLTPRGAGLLEEGSRRLFGPRLADWDGRWHLVIYSLPQEMRALRRELRARLSWLGYGMLLPGIMVAAHSRRERVEAIRQSVQAVEEVRKAITAVLVEEKRLVGSARSSEQALKQAIDSIGTWLEKAVDVALRGVLTKQEQGLQDFQRLVGRLSVSGGSPFQTAKAQVLQHLLSKENIGGKHTSRERALESLDQRLRRYGDQALDDLIRMGLVAQKPAAYGMQVAVVAQRVRDAEHFIEGGELQQGS